MTSRSTDTVRRGQRSVASTDALAASSTGQPLAAGSGGSRSVNGSPRRPGEVAGDPRHAPGVRAVALDRDVEDGVDPQPERLHDRGAGLARLLVTENQEAGSVVGEAELLAGAQHAVGGHAAQLALADFEVTGQDRTNRRERHPVPHLEVGRTADDLEWLRSAAIDDGEADFVGTLDRADVEHPSHHHLAEPFADVLDRLDHEPEVVQGVTQCPDVVGKRSEITKPAERCAHGGLSRCGVSSELREEADVVLEEGAHVWDGVTHLRQPVDAEPEREAGPDVGVDAHGGEDGRIDHAAATELDPARLRAGAAASPRQTVQVISYSADGSVNGK